jgi:hypothetical protein
MVLFVNSVSLLLDVHLSYSHITGQMRDPDPDPSDSRIRIPRSKIVAMHVFSIKFSLPG